MSKKVSHYYCTVFMGGNAVLYLYDNLTQTQKENERQTKANTWRMSCD